MQKEWQRHFPNHDSIVKGLGRPENEKGPAMGKAANNGYPGIHSLGIERGLQSFSRHNGLDQIRLDIHYNL